MLKLRDYNHFTMSKDLENIMWTLCTKWHMAACW